MDITNSTCSSSDSSPDVNNLSASVVLVILPLVLSETISIVLVAMLLLLLLRLLLSILVTQSTHLASLDYWHCYLQCQPSVSVQIKVNHWPHVCFLIHAQNVHFIHDWLAYMRKLFCCRELASSFTLIFRQIVFISFTADDDLLIVVSCFDMHVQHYRAVSSISISLCLSRSCQIQLICIVNRSPPTWKSGTHFRGRPRQVRSDCEMSVFKTDHDHQIYTCLTINHKPTRIFMSEQILQSKRKKGICPHMCSCPHRNCFPFQFT